MDKGYIIKTLPEIPEDCYHCEMVDTFCYCQYVGKYIDRSVKPGERHPLCPIELVPERKNVQYDCANPYDTGHSEGYNDCIDKIFGGSDE